MSLNIHAAAILLNQLLSKIDNDFDDFLKSSMLLNNSAISRDLQVSQKPAQCDFRRRNVDTLSVSSELQNGPLKMTDFRKRFQIGKGSANAVSVKQQEVQRYLIAYLFADLKTQSLSIAKHIRK
ncbi:hypothetical protein CEXT_15701 [Caerostris extrusa]|uniref:Uncharacterized protein n=1 Tax=Caerostris extrusa TaxID=172846 RepID=A0AAV4XRX6_CAEEX|nr:hypothetical protein CEXT_15701 [Caerostris extrusa]